MARKHLYLNDVDVANYGIYINSDTYLDSPQISYTEHTIPGRNGTVLQYNKRMNNVTRKFTCYVPVKANIETALASLKKLIYLNPGYLKIVSDYDNSIYQYGFLSQEINVQVFDKKNATFDLYFSCEPQKYFETGQKYSANTKSVARLRKIATRNYVGISQTFANMPIDAVPSYDAYCIFALGQRSKNAVETTNISVTTTSPFVAVYSGWVKTPLLSDPDSFNELIAYSTNGALTWSGEVTGRTYVIVPADYFGSIVGNDGTYTINTTPSSSLTVSNATALGVSFDFEAQMTYVANADATPLYMYLYSTSENNKTFEAIISFDVEKFNTDYGVSGTTTLSIAVDTLEASIYSAATGDIKANEYISIEGSLSGISDSLSVVAYNANNELLNVSRVSITPAWWTL